MRGFLDPDRVVTVLAPHQCAYCGSEIAPGTAGVLVESGVRCGEWFRHYVCAGCQPHVAPFRRWCGGEYPADVAEAFAAYRADLP